MADPLSDFLTSAAPSVAGTGSFLDALGMFQRGQGLASHGASQEQAMAFAAEQLRQNANAVAGATQRTAQDVGRQAQYVMSTQLARAAASGGGASDPSVISLMGRTAAFSAYRQQTALYAGESQARQMNLQAAGDEWSGGEEARVSRMAGSGADFGAASVLAKGGVSLLEKYGRNRPGSDISD